MDTYWTPKKQPENYYHYNPGNSNIRVRRQDGKTIVTYKKKEIRNKIEVNEEKEFEVSDAFLFEELLQRLGLEVSLRKHKIGKVWEWDGMTIELSLVETLGWFIELEILADTNDSETVNSARHKLLACLDRLGIPEEAIESRYYTEMLQNSR